MKKSSHELTFNCPKCTRAELQPKRNTSRIRTLLLGIRIKWNEFRNNEQENETLVRKSSSNMFKVNCPNCSYSANMDEAMEKIAQSQAQHSRRR